MSTGEFCPKCRKYYDAADEQWRCKCSTTQTLSVHVPPPQEKKRVEFGSVMVMDPEKVHSLAVVFDTYKLNNFALVVKVWGESEKVALSKIHGFVATDLFHQEQFIVDNNAKLTAQKRYYTPRENRRNK